MHPQRRRCYHDIPIGRDHWHMFDFSQLIAAYNALANGIKTLADLRLKKGERHRAALLSVYIAANESKSYIAGLKLRKSPDQTREAQIARLWSEAALNMRPIDRNLADKCLLFSSTIAEATAWTTSEIDQARTSVSAIFEQARKLL